MTGPDRQSVIETAKKVQEATRVVTSAPAVSYEQKKREQAIELRKQALAANGVGQSLRHLAPVVRGELRSVIGLLLQSGKLAEQWENAQKAAAEADVPDDAKSLAAVATMLTAFAGEAAKRIMSHGDILVDRRAEFIGKASAIEEMLGELEAAENGDEDDGTATE